MAAKKRGKHELTAGMDYRVGDHYVRHEAGEIVDDLDSIDQETYEGLVARELAKPVKAGKVTPGRVRGKVEEA